MNRPKAGTVPWPDTETLLGWVERGDTLQEMGDRVGVTREAVRQRLARMGTSTSVYRERRYERGMRLIASGMPARQAALRVGVDAAGLRKHAREAGIPLPIKPIRHGTRTGYNRGCRCEPCTATNRHDQHIMRRRHLKRQLPNYRADRKPCALCEAEGYGQPVKVVEQVCRYCGDTHEVAQ